MSLIENNPSEGESKVNSPKLFYLIEVNVVTNIATTCMLGIWIVGHLERGTDELFAKVYV